MIERQAFSYPPFKNLVTIKIINESRIQTIDISKRLAIDLKNQLKEHSDVEIIGPNPCKISRINNKHRYNIIVKAKDEDLSQIVYIINELKNLYISKYKETSFIPAINPVSIN